MVNLDCRLAYACNQAYGGTEASYPAGFLPGVQRIVARPDSTNVALVGAFPGNAAVVDFRGTLPPQIPFEHTSADFRIAIDWADDFRADWVCPHWLSEDCPNAMVHSGWAFDLEDLWADIKLAVKALKPIAVVFTGHSKGGAMAALAGARWYIEEPTAHTVTTFAAPKPGNAAFSTHMFANYCVRYEFADDLVPHLPELPALFGGYSSYGKLRYINRAGELEPAVTQTERVVSMAKQFTRCDVERVIKDHRIGRTLDMGYLRALETLNA